MLPSRNWLLVGLLLTLPALLGGQDADRCRSSAPYQPSTDLYCLELLPARDIPAAVVGHAILDFTPGPFTVAVTVDGILRYQPQVVLAGLPEPATIDSSATVYVAWATTPLFSEWVNLGPVHNGITRVGELAFEQFVIVISAEARPDGEARLGRLVLRGGSPSTRLQPPDFQQFAAGIIGLTTDELEAVEAAGESMTMTADSAGWTGVPMPPGIGMLPALMALKPDEQARLPNAEGEIQSAARRRVVTLADGDSLLLVADRVRKRIHGSEHVMFAFNGQIPGPMLRVARGTEVHIRFQNNLDQPSSVHWHGLRLDHRMDGAPPVSQDPVPAGGSFDYSVRFPDAGLYWYHPHVREEMQQDLGLSGNIAVSGMAGLPAVDREEVLLLDDLLITEQGLVPFGQEKATHAMMGRFGNLLLVNGEPRWESSARPGSTVRLWFTNAANTRTFNLSVTNATMRLVAGDLGPFEPSPEIESLVLAPAERYAVDVTFRGVGPWRLVNRVRALDHLFARFIQRSDTLGQITATSDQLPTEPPFISSGAGPEASRDSMIGQGHGATPDLTLEFGLRTRDLPFVTERLMLLDSAYFHPVEWTGTMPMMNWASTTDQIEWFVRNTETGLENEAANFVVRRGERRVIRLVNIRNGLHAMQHPIHVHGQRFKVLSVNGRPPTVGAWKDTVLLPAGGTVDLLVEFTNPGRWMLHCHIAEHVEAGMMTTFTVEN